VDQDVQTSELLQHFSNGFVDPGSCADVCLDKQFGWVSFGQRRTRGGADRRAAGFETTDDRFTHSLTSTRDKDAFASELGFAHEFNIALALPNDKNAQQSKVLTER
jgi:hypothetical protein